MKIIDGRNDIAEVKELIIAYTKSLGRDLSFQNLDAELQDIEKKYCAPNGELFVAKEDERVVGMVAYHQLTNERCEMKRLYVKPEMRGRHVSKDLLETLLEHAKSAGYSEMVLDTIEPLKAAIHLYKSFGFEECEPYYDNPMSDVIYMKKAL